MIYRMYFYRLCCVSLLTPYDVGRWGDARLFDDVTAVPPLTSPSPTTTTTGAIEGGGGGGGGGGSKEHRLAMWGKCIPYFTFVMYIHIHIYISYHACACMVMLMDLCMLPPYLLAFSF